MKLLICIILIHPFMPVHSTDDDIAMRHMEKALATLNAEASKTCSEEEMIKNYQDLMCSDSTYKPMGGIVEKSEWYDDELGEFQKKFFSTEARTPFEKNIQRMRNNLVKDCEEKEKNNKKLEDIRAEELKFTNGHISPELYTVLSKQSLFHFNDFGGLNGGTPMSPSEDVSPQIKEMQDSFYKKNPDVLISHLSSQIPFDFIPPKTMTKDEIRKLIIEKGTHKNLIKEGKITEDQLVEAISLGRDMRSLIVELSSLDQDEYRNLVKDSKMGYFPKEGERFEQIIVNDNGQIKVDSTNPVNKAKIFRTKIDANKELETKLSMSKERLDEVKKNVFRHLDENSVQKKQIDFILANKEKILEHTKSKTSSNVDDSRGGIETQSKKGCGLDEKIRPLVSLVYAKKKYEDPQNIKFYDNLAKKAKANVVKTIENSSLSKKSKVSAAKRITDTDMSLKRTTKTVNDAIREHTETFKSIAAMGVKNPSPTSELKVLEQKLSPQTEDDLRRLLKVNATALIEDDSVVCGCGFFTEKSLKRPYDLLSVQTHELGHLIDPGAQLSMHKRVLASDAPESDKAEIRKKMEHLKRGYSKESLAKLSRLDDCLADFTRDSADYSGEAFADLISNKSMVNFYKDASTTDKNFSLNKVRYLQNILDNICMIKMEDYDPKSERGGPHAVAWRRSLASLQEKGFMSFYPESELEEILKLGNETMVGKCEELF